MKKYGISLMAFSLISLLSSSLSFGAGDSVKGQIVYDAFCISCHGGKGAGDGPDAVTMTPKPTNFTDPSATATLTTQDIERAILTGKPGTAMKAFGGILLKEDFENLATYLNSLMMKQ
jgi:high-affinity iron transporter